MYHIEWIAFVVITLFCGYPLAMELMVYKERCVAILHRYYLRSRTIHLPPHNSPIFRAVSKKEISDDSMPTEPQFQLNHCTCIAHNFRVLFTTFQEFWAYRISQFNGDEAALMRYFRVRDVKHAESLARPIILAIQQAIASRNECPLHAPGIIRMIDQF